MRNRFILYDIDGTLVSMNRSFMPALIDELLRRMGRDEVKITDTSFAGRTDRDIFSSLLASNGLEDSFFDDIRTHYLSVLDEMLQPDHLVTHSGAAESIEFCKQIGTQAGLLTGNFEEAAFTKLNRAGLDHYFSVGAYGGDHHDRNKLPEVAFARGRDLIGTSLKPSDLIIIGDTPKDIECARHFGSVSVAVSTGSYSREMLAAHKPDILLDSLNNPEVWLRPLIEI